MPKPKPSPFETHDPGVIRLIPAADATDARRDRLNGQAARDSDALHDEADTLIRLAEGSQDAKLRRAYRDQARELRRRADGLEADIGADLLARLDKYFPPKTPKTP